MVGGGDIRYELRSGRTIRERWLSDDVGPQPTNELARRIATINTIKGNARQVVRSRRSAPEVGRALGHRTARRPLPGTKHVLTAHPARSAPNRCAAAWPRKRRSDCSSVRWGSRCGTARVRGWSGVMDSSV
jgi:hypothetical protein